MKEAPTRASLPTMWWDGALMIAHNLPNPGTIYRWTPKRKAMFMRAIRHGLISREHFLSSYNVNEDELDQWIPAQCASPIENGAATERNLDTAPITCGDLVIEPASRKVTIGDELIDFTNCEYRALECIARHREKGCAAWKDAIMEHVYQARIKKPDPKIVDVLVCKIRKKLADASEGNEYLDTVWGRGYLLREEPINRSVSRLSRAAGIQATAV